MKLSACAFCLLFVHAAAAQEETSGATWSGEGAASFSLTSGNTDTTDFATHAAVARTQKEWKIGGRAESEFGRSADVETRNRQFLSAYIGRDVSERFALRGDTSFLSDRFSGYDSNIFLGAGLLYHLVRTDALSWSVAVSPGIRFNTTASATVEGVTTDGVTTTAFGAQAKSSLSWTVTDKITFGWDIGADYVERYTLFESTARLDMNLFGNIDVRALLNNRLTTNALPGREAVDTLIRFGIVYKFAGK